MRSDRIEQKLRELFGRSASKESDPELEARLIARQRTLYPPTKGWTMNFNPRLHPGRLVLASAFLLLLGLGACSVPSSYDVEVGQAMAIQFSKQIEGSAPELQEMLGHMDGLPGVEGVMVNQRITPDGTRLDIRLSGTDIDVGQVAAELSERFPLLADAEISTHPIERSVEGPFYERIAHEVFGWEFSFEVTGDTPEEIELEILEQFAAEGYDGDVDVDVTMDEEAGATEIQMELRIEDGDPGSDGDE